MQNSTIHPGDYESPHRRYLYNWLSHNRVLSASLGTPYPCSQYNLNECAYNSNDCPHSLQFPEQAATELEWFLDPNSLIDSTVRAAILRLRAGLEIQDWKPDLVIKAFHDLDTVFFNGKLRGHVTIQWQTASWWTEYNHGQYCRAYGLTRYLGHQRAAIQLNAFAILLNTPDPKVWMWKAVLHEMVVS